MTKKIIIPRISRMDDSLEIMKAAPVPEPIVDPASLPMEQQPKFLKLCEILQSPDKDGSAVDVPLEFIHLGKNVRKKIDPESEAFKALVQSLKKDGLINPVTIQLENGKPTLKAGFRRYKAISTLGWPQIKVIVKTRPDANGDVIQAIENIVREDLDPLDYCDALKLIKSHESLTSNDALAERVGLKDRGLVGYYLKAADWPEDIKDQFRETGLTRTHIFKICRSKETSETPEQLRKAIAFYAAAMKANENKVPERQGATAAPIDKATQATINKLLRENNVEKGHRKKVKKLASLYTQMEPNEKKAFAEMLTVL